MVSSSSSSSPCAWCSFGDERRRKKALCDTIMSSSPFDKKDTPSNYVIKERQKISRRSKNKEGIFIVKKRATIIIRTPLLSCFTKREEKKRGKILKEN